MCDELAALRAYVHVLEARVQEYEARERILRSRAHDSETYESIFTAICDTCDGPYNDVMVEVTPLGMQCGMCERMCCETCCGADAAECSVCYEWICDTCVAKDPRRKVRKITTTLSSTHGPTFAYHKYICGRHEPDYTPLEDSGAL